MTWKWVKLVRHCVCRDNVLAITINDIIFGAKRGQRHVSNNYTSIVKDFQHLAKVEHIYYATILMVLF